MNLQKNFLRSTDVSIKILFLTLFFCLHAFTKPGSSPIIQRRSRPGIQLESTEVKK